MRHATVMQKSSKPFSSEQVQKMQAGICTIVKVYIALLCSLCGLQSPTPVHAAPRGMTRSNYRGRRRRVDAFAASDEASGFRA